MARRVIKYLATVRDSASRAEDFLKDAFSGIEDAIVQFATTGKLEIRELANSIVADLIRIQIQKQITGPLANWLGGLLGGGSASWLSGLFHNGGPVTAATPLRSLAQGTIGTRFGPLAVPKGRQRLHRINPFTVSRREIAPLIP